MGWFDWANRTAMVYKQHTKVVNKGADLDPVVSIREQQIEKCEAFTVSDGNGYFKIVTNQPGCIPNSIIFRDLVYVLPKKP